MGRYAMIVDKFEIYKWKVTIIYEADCDDIDFIIETLKDIHCPDIYINRALDNLEECKLNSGLTYSNITLKSSVIVINKTTSYEQCVNTIVHEYYHLLCHISHSLDIEEEEELANLMGYLVMNSLEYLKKWTSE